MLFSVESAAMGVAMPTGGGTSADGDEGIIRLFRDICSMLRRQLATISSPRSVPKVSTFWKGGGSGPVGGEFEDVRCCWLGGSWGWC